MDPNKNVLSSRKKFQFCIYQLKMSKKNRQWKYLKRPNFSKLDLLIAFDILEKL